VLIRAEGKLYLNTPAARTATLEFYSEHVGFDDFRLVVNGYVVLLTCVDDTCTGDVLKQLWGLTRRLFCVSGPSSAVDSLVARLYDLGHNIFQEEQK